MTREQTIEKLKVLYTNAVAAMLRADACDDDESAKVMTEYAETLDSAINALETALQTDGDCISRQAAIDAILAVTGNSSVRELYEHVQEHGLSDMWSGGVNAAIDIIIAVPSVQPEPCEDAISRADAIRVASGYCHPANVAKELAKLPSVHPDMSGYSDRLWKAAYERGRAEAQADIIHCRDCKWQKDQSGSTAWLPCRALVTPSDFYCGRAERRTDGQTVSE